VSKASPVEIKALLRAAVEANAPADILDSIERAAPGYCGAEEAGTAELERLLKCGARFDDFKAGIDAHPLPSMRPSRQESKARDLDKEPVLHRCPDPVRLLCEEPCDYSCARQQHSQVERLL